MSQLMEFLLKNNALDTHVHKPDDVPLAVTTVVVDPEKKEKSLMDIRQR